MPSSSLESGLGCQQGLATSVNHNLVEQKSADGGAGRNYKIWAKWLVLLAMTQGCAGRGGGFGYLWRLLAAHWLRGFDFIFFFPSFSDAFCLNVLLVPIMAGVASTWRI